MGKSYVHIHLVLDSKQADNLVKLVKKSGRVSLKAVISPSKKKKKRKPKFQDDAEERGGVGDDD